MVYDHESVYTDLLTAVVLFQVWRSSPESHTQAACYHKQVLPAHRDGITRLLSALETAQPVSVCVYTQDKLLNTCITNCSLNEKHAKFTSHRPQQEAQKIFKANHGMDTEVLKAKVGLHNFITTL